MMNIAFMQPGQEKTVIALVTEVFDQYVAPGYPQQGIEEFYNFANEVSLARRSLSNSFTIIGYQDGRAAGVIEIRDMSHVAMFFVKSAYQHRGIGKALFSEAVAVIQRKSDSKTITVKSAPNAVTVYERLGFKQQDEEQMVNGIRYIPMIFSLKE